MTLKFIIKVNCLKFRCFDNSKTIVSRIIHYGVHVHVDSGIYMLNGQPNYQCLDLHCKVKHSQFYRFNYKLIQLDRWNYVAPCILLFAFGSREFKDSLFGDLICFNDFE